ncbi:MAG: VOC family protein [Candidatus Limivicinus sp.]|jgi:glyoxylase I family protein
MIGQIYHVGLTVSDLDRSVSFYRDILGLRYLGEIIMEGEETDILFQRKNCRARVAYLNGSEKTDMPPVELIQFHDTETKRGQADLFSESVSELCFYTDDIDKTYRSLISQNVECLSAPQNFDFTAAGFGKSRAFYFKDPDGIVLEMMQPL